MSTSDPSVIASIKPGARIRDLSLAGESLREVQAPGLRAEAVDFRGADLSRAGLKGARLSDCELADALLEDADLTEATLRACRLNGVCAAGCVMVRVRLEDSVAQSADFSRANLTGAHLTETSFARTLLRGALLGEVSGDGLDFRGADLAGADLSAARMIDADFRGADLTGASLTQGCFKGADFRGAIVDAVDWSGSELTGALFDIGAEPIESKEVEPSPTSQMPVEPLVAWTEDLLKEAVSTFPPALAGGEAARTPADLKRLMKGLRRSLAARGVKEDRLFSSFQQAIETLESAPDSEPPEAWKPALEEILTRLHREKREPDLKEVFELLLEKFKPSPPEHRAHGRGDGCRETRSGSGAEDVE